MIGLITLPSIKPMKKCDKCPLKEGCTSDDRVKRQIEAFRNAAIGACALVEICI